MRGLLGLAAQRPTGRSLAALVRMPGQSLLLGVGAVSAYHALYFTTGGGALRLLASGNRIIVSGKPRQGGGP